MYTMSHQASSCMLNTAQSMTFLKHWLKLPPCLSDFSNIKLQRAPFRALIKPKKSMRPERSSALSGYIQFL